MVTRDNVGIVNDYNAWCRSRAIRIFGPNPHHVCHTQCRLWQHPKQSHIYVCHSSRQIHFCGSRCAYGVVDRNLENTVCALTGFVIGGPAEITYTRLSKDSYGSGNKLIGDNYVRMGTKQHQKSAARTPKSYSRLVRSTVVNILHGHERDKQYKHAKHRFTRDVVTIARRISTKKGLSFVAMQQHIVAIYNEHKSMLSTPIPHVDQRIDMLTKAIVAYWNVMQRFLHNSIKNVITFTAVCITKLRDGCVINGITVFPRNPWLALHTPADIQFGGITNIQCRSMSYLWRKMVQAIICSSTNMPQHALLFDTYLCI